MIRIDVLGRPAAKALVLGFAWAFATACGDAEAGGAAQGGFGGGDGPPPMPVDVSVAVRDTAIEAISATGQIEAVQSIELRPDVDGRIVEILVREGAIVGAGTPLFKVDDAELVAQTARLEAERDLAAQSLARTRELLAQDAASQAELEQTEARARGTQAELELTQLRLERTVVRAPFGGVVGQRFVSLGDYVTTSTGLVTLQTVDPQRAVFDVPERYAARLELGQAVSFRVAAVTDRSFQGVVDFVDPVVQLPGRTILIKAQVGNPDRVLQSGMFIEARLATEIRADAVIVPEDALLPLEMGTFVWVVTPEGTATRRAVILGIRRPGFVEIVDGVQAGEPVVVGGLERLFEGARVMPNQVERGGEPAPTELRGGDAPVGEVADSARSEPNQP